MHACHHCGLPVPASRVRGGAEARQFCCFGCRFADGIARPVDPGDSPQTSLLLVRLGLGIFLALNIMVFSWSFYSTEVFGQAARAGEEYSTLTGLFAYLLMFLCTLVLVLVGFPLLADALEGLRAGRIDINLLVVIGVVSAYALSVWHTVRGEGSLYYDTAAMVLVLITLGNYLEAGARRRATDAASALLAALPRRVWVRRGDHLEQIDAVDVRRGDRVRVRAGETAAVDGPVREGRSHLDSSSLTGESQPRAVGTGDHVLAGSVSLDGDLWVEAERIGDERTISRMQTLLLEARLDRPAVQRIADRVAAMFVPAVVTLALVLFGWHAFQGAVANGLLVALGVLLISCPCALGLAAPLSTWSALHRATGRGIVFDSALTLEKASRIKQVFFDKTGTLTAPTPEPVAMTLACGVSRDDALHKTASVEAASLHPLARGLVRYAAKQGIAPSAVERFEVLPGLGVEARLAGETLRLGGAALLERFGLEGIDSPHDGTVPIYLADDRRVLARFDLAETPRPDAKQAIESLRERGVSVAALSGDHERPSRRLGESLGIDVAAALLPADKVDRLRAARPRGPVAMVGDGINDAPVLAAADVGIAVASASDLAQHAGNVRLVTERVVAVPEALAMAKHATRRIRLSLAWAFGYNAIGIPLAAFGLLTPVFAASAMVLSSLIVVALARGAGAV